MNLLSIDTSTEIASVALLLGDVISCEVQDSQRTHAQLLLPMIDKLLVNAGLSINQLDGIIFGRGPGSFTGLRIACSVAKGLAYAHDLDLIPVSGLASIAWSARQQLGDVTLPILAVVDARMHEMYWSYFPENQYVAEEHVTAVSHIDISPSNSFVIAGVGIDLYWPEFPDGLKSLINSPLCLYPNAADMIRLVQHTDIKPVSVAQAQPVYVRNQVTQGEPRG